MCARARSTAPRPVTRACLPLLDRKHLNLPNFLVIGAQRAGTTLLHNLLASHPDVYVPFQRKEVHYFDRYFERGNQWYSSYFPSSERDGRYIAVGEVTPDYLAHPLAPNRIHLTLPDCRLITILRNPVDRAFSWYQYSRRNTGDRRSFDRFLDEDPTVVEYGLYFKHLSRYWQLAPCHALHVLFYEDLVADPIAAVQAVATFLGLPRAFPDPSGRLTERINAGVAPRRRAAFAVARRLGAQLMRHDVNWPGRLAKRLGVRAWFGREGQVAMLEERSRRRASALFHEDAANLGRSLDRDLVGFWQLHPDDGPDPR